MPGAIALVVPDVSEAYGLDLLQSIEERCAEEGANLIVRRTRGRQADEEQAIESLVASGEVDGLIVFPVHGDFYNASLLRQVLYGFHSYWSIGICPASRCPLSTPTTSPPRGP